MDVASIVDAKEEILIRPSDEISWLLPQSFPRPLGGYMKVETLYKQLVVKSVHVRRNRLPVYVKPHGRDV